MKIEQTDQTPKITFETLDVLKIEGNSYSVDPRNLYNKVIERIQEYKDEIKMLEVTIDLDVFNTITAKKLLDIFKSLEGSNTKIIWVYAGDDEDIKMAGHDYESMIKLPFEFKEKQ